MGSTVFALRLKIEITLKLDALKSMNFYHHLGLKLHMDWQRFVSKPLLWGMRFPRRPFLLSLPLLFV